MAKAEAAPAQAAPVESRMHRLRVGDVVAWDDASEFPPIHHEGPITGFDNDEMTYVVVDFGESESRVLTEDEVKRVG